MINDESHRAHVKTLASGLKILKCLNEKLVGTTIVGLGYKLYVHINYNK